MTLLVLGNHDPLDEHRRGGRSPRQSVHITLTDEYPAALLDLLADGSPWWTYAKRGSRPAWVASDDPDLAAAIGTRLGIEVRPVELPTSSPEPEAPITRAELRDLIRTVLAEGAAKPAAGPAARTTGRPVT